ncbi:MAG: protein kinase family protein, partial [Leptolyngbyaceae bacterium]|nr:protein kinase family protein [Leptolyngbyaceae bacterium]
YMPNEQLAGRPRYSSDIYAAGMVALRAVTGRSPCKLPEDIRSGEICWRDRAPHISAPLADVITKMTCYDFRERYTTAAETLSALADIEPEILASAVMEGPAVAVEPLANLHEPTFGKVATTANVILFPLGKGTAEWSVAVTDLSEDHGTQGSVPMVAEDPQVTEPTSVVALPRPGFQGAGFQSPEIPPPPASQQPFPSDLLDSLAHDHIMTASVAIQGSESSDVSMTSESLSVDEYCSQGDKFFQDQQYGRAITAYGLSLRAHPDDYILWFKQAMALEYLNRHQEAIACYHKVLKLQPQDYLAWSKLGKALETLEQYDEAVDAYTQVLQIQPQNYWAWHDQGRALEAAQQIETAIASYDRAIQLKPDFQLAIDRRKRLLTQLKEVDRLYHLQHYDEALQSCLETVQTNPDDPLAWLTQGMTLENAQYYQAAVDAYEKVIALDPQDTLAQFRRGGVLEKLGRYQEAAIAYRSVTRLQADNHWAWNDLGRMLETLQHCDHAMVAYNKAITLQPTLDTAIAGRDRMIRHLQQRASMA